MGELQEEQIKRLLEKDIEELKNLRLCLSMKENDADGNVKATAIVVAVFTILLNGYTKMIDMLADGRLYFIFIAVFAIAFLIVARRLLRIIMTHSKIKKDLALHDYCIEIKSNLKEVEVRRVLDKDKVL